MATKTKKLYVLRTTINVGYDAYNGFIIRARNAQEAREQAQEIANNDQWDPERRGLDTAWLDENKSTCKPLSARGKLGFVFGSFRHG